MMLQSYYRKKEYKSERLPTVAFNTSQPRQTRVLSLNTTPSSLPVPGSMKLYYPTDQAFFLTQGHRFAFLPFFRESKGSLNLRERLTLRYKETKRCRSS